MPGQQFGATQTKFAFHALDIGACQLIPHGGDSFQRIGNGSGLRQCYLGWRDLDGQFDGRRDDRPFCFCLDRFLRLRLGRMRIAAASRGPGSRGQPRRDLRQQAIAPLFCLRDLSLEQLDETVILSGARSR
jgi:hypothetical protein